MSHEHFRFASNGRDDHSGNHHPLGGLRLVTVDDNALHRATLAKALRTCGAAEVGAAWDVRSLRLAYEAVQPQVVLLSIETNDATTLLRAARAIDAVARVIAVGVSDDDATQIAACAECGVAGYHTRRESFADLLTLIHRVAAGEMSFSPAFATTLLHRLAAMASQRRTVVRELVLTEREAQILRMLEQGKSNHQIAVQLSVAVPTVKNHVHNLLKKLGVSSRADAAALARSSRRPVE